MKLLYTFPSPSKLLEALPNGEFPSLHSSKGGRKKAKLVGESFSSSSDSNWKGQLNFDVRFWFSRYNRYMIASRCKEDLGLVQFRGGKSRGLKEVWKVLLGSCVDASPLVVCDDRKVSIFIGSHSHNFLSIDALRLVDLWFIQGK
jgi:hypothetical protein